MSIWSTVIDTAKNIAPIAAAGYSIYSGLEANNRANDAYNVAAGSAKQQDAIAKAQWNIAKPLAEKQAQVDTATADAYLGLLPGNTQAKQQGQANDLADLRLYGQYMPGLTEKAYQGQTQDMNAYLANADTRTATIDQQFGNQLASEQLAGQGITAAGNDLAQYEANRGMVQEFYDQARDGLDPTQQADMAAADIAQAFGNQQAAQRRDMSRMGVNPNSGRFADQSRLNATARAAATAGARTKARQDTKQLNFSRLGDGVNVLKGMAPSTGMGTSFTPTSPAASAISRTGLTSPDLNTSGANSALSGYGSSGSTMASLGNAASKAASSDMAAGGYLLNMGLS
jgi:hypothetical protein